MQETADLCTAGADPGIGTVCKYNDFDRHANQESNRHILNCVMCIHRGCVTWAMLTLLYHLVRLHGDLRRQPGIIKEHCTMLIHLPVLLGLSINSVGGAPIYMTVCFRLVVH